MNRIGEKNATVHISSVIRSFYGDKSPGQDKPSPERFSEIDINFATVCDQCDYASGLLTLLQASLEQQPFDFGGPNPHLAERFDVRQARLKIGSLRGQ